MINRIIEEIKVCLHNNCYLAALSTALTIPDICGKAEYGGQNNKKRYIQWFDKYVGCYEKTNSKEMPYIDGELVYDLRNHTLHEGTFDINGKELHIDEFELLVQDVNRSILTCSSSGIETDNNGLTRKLLCINVVELITKICLSAESYYKQNKEKFNFIENKVVVIDSKTKKKFNITQNLKYEDIIKLNEEQIKIQWEPIIKSTRSNS